MSAAIRGTCVFLEPARRATQRLARVLDLPAHRVRQLVARIGDDARDFLAEAVEDLAARLEQLLALLQRVAGTALERAARAARALAHGLAVRLELAPDHRPDGRLLPEDHRSAHAKQRADHDRRDVIAVVEVRHLFLRFKSTTRVPGIMQRSGRRVTSGRCRACGHPAWARRPRAGATTTRPGTVRAARPAPSGGESPPAPRPAGAVPPGGG